jgi:uncharacterized protein
MVIGRFLPREGRFYELFNEHAEQMVLGARELLSLMRDFSDMERRVRNIESFEKRADKITHATIDLLHTTFITPIDRDDIHQLITRMDDVLDHIEDAGQTFMMFDIHSVTPEAIRLAEICVTCCEKVQAALGLLRQKHNLKPIRALCEEIDRLESEADHVMRAAMARLFREEPDARQWIKLRAIYELMEAITDHCEDVGNVIEGIVIEST